MSYDPNDGAMDDMYERISDELYPEHKSQAIDEFTADRLRSFYLVGPGARLSSPPPRAACLPDSNLPLKKLRM